MKYTREQLTKLVLKENNKYYMVVSSVVGLGLKKIKDYDSPPPYPVFYGQTISSINDMIADNKIEIIENYLEDPSYETY